MSILTKKHMYKGKCLNATALIPASCFHLRLLARHADTSVRLYSQYQCTHYKYFAPIRYKYQSFLEVQLIVGSCSIRISRSSSTNLFSNSIRPDPRCLRLSNPGGLSSSCNQNSERLHPSKSPILKRGSQLVHAQKDKGPGMDRRTINLSFSLSFEACMIVLISHRILT